MSENEEWQLVMFTDSDFGGDKDTRISITGYILYVLGVPISWKLKSQRSVTLSSSEVALSEAAKEIKFVAQIIEALGIKVKLPIIVRVDNVGAIFMTENISTSSRSKHIDLRHRYVNEMVEDGFIKIIFVRTNDNDADIFTKNVNGKIYANHVDKFIGRLED